MPETKPHVPLHGTRPAMDLTCARMIPGGHCARPAVWHVFWDEELENGVTCQEHYDEARERWSMVDAHPIGAVCTMPDTTVVWSWEDAPGYCQWVIGEDTMAEAIAAEREPEPVAR